MTIREEILTIFSACSIKENTIFLPQIQLDRKTYIEVNKHLGHLGGKWNRKAKGHVFNDDPTDIFENMLLTGEVTDLKKEFQFFETPPVLARKMVAMAEFKETDNVLEPSAGMGAIAKEIKTGTLFCNELNPEMAGILVNKLGFTVSCADFINMTAPRNYNKIIMNPPFSKQKDVDHILHAHSLLSGRGILVSIVSESPFFRVNKKSAEFRKFLNDNNAEIIKNPEGTFKISGTMVNTRIIKIIKEQ